MSGTSAYVIGMRVTPDSAGPDWYTLWCDVGDGPNLIVTKDGRMQWSPTVDGARRMAELIDGEVWTDPAEPNAVCDVAGTLHDIASGTTGNEGIVLDTLNFLDDMLITIRQTLPEEPKLRLDRVSGRLTEGVSLPDVVAAHEGTTAVLEAVLASLGRVFALSDFSCD